MRHKSKQKTTMIDRKPNLKHQTEAENPIDQNQFEFGEQANLTKNKETDAIPIVVEAEIEEQTTDTMHSVKSGRPNYDGLMIYRGDHYCQHNEQFVNNF